MTRLALRCIPWLLVLGLLCAGRPPLIGADDPPAGHEDDETLHTAGLETDGPSLLAFFNARARADIDPERLRILLQQLTAASNQERSLATAEFLGLGPLAIPTLRRAANDLSEPEVARRAAHCLKWLEGAPSTSLPVAAARVLAQRKPKDSAAALLSYLPFADNKEVLQAITSALAAVALPNGKPDPALLRGLADPLAVRRAAAGVALARAATPDQVPDVRKLLKDSAPGVRLRTALALAEAHDQEAVPVLIELLADLPIEQRKRVEDFLQGLAGEWAPALNFAGEDEIGRKIRRDAWSIWSISGACARMAALADHCNYSGDRGA
jgi:HEAT repeat protein